MNLLRQPLLDGIPIQLNFHNAAEACWCTIMACAFKNLRSGRRNNSPTTSGDIRPGAIFNRVPKYAYWCYLALINFQPSRRKRGGYTHRFHVAGW